MASIRRRGDRWHVQVRRKDHPPICKAFAQRKDAEVWGRETRRATANWRWIKQPGAVPPERLRR